MRILNIYLRYIIYILQFGLSWHWVHRMKVYPNFFMSIQCLTNRVACMLSLTAYLWTHTYGNHIDPKAIQHQVQISHCSRTQSSWQVCQVHAPSSHHYLYWWIWASISSQFLQNLWALQEWILPSPNCKLNSHYFSCTCTHFLYDLSCRCYTIYN